MDINQEILDKAGVKKSRRKFSYVRIVEMERMIGYHQAVNDEYTASALMLAAQSLRIKVRPEAIEAFRLDELNQIEVKRQRLLDKQAS